MALQYLELAGMAIVIFALMGFVYWFLMRGWKNQKRYNRARTIAAQENVRRVREEQQRLREQQRQQRP